MENLEKLNEEYIDLRSRVLNLCYQLEHPQVFKEPINIEMLGRETEEIIGINEDGYLYNKNHRLFSFDDDVVGVGELIYLLENI